MVYIYVCSWIYNYHYVCAWIHMNHLQNGPDLMSDLTGDIQVVVAVGVNLGHGHAASLLVVAACVPRRRRPDHGVGKVDRLGLAPLLQCLLPVVRRRLLRARLRPLRALCILLLSALLRYNMCVCVCVVCERESVCVETHTLEFVTWHS
jgi:hypothetical protein